jgi:hypothetical protein
LANYKEAMVSTTDSSKALAATAAGSPAKASGKADASAPVRSAAEIEAELNATRDRLAGTVAILEERLNPRHVMDRTVADAKSKVSKFYLDDAGKVRPDRVAITAGAVVAGLIGLRLTFRGLRWLTAPPKPKLPDTDIVYVPVNREQLLAVDPAALGAA